VVYGDFEARRGRATDMEILTVTLKPGGKRAQTRRGQQQGTLIPARDFFQQEIKFYKALREGRRSPERIRGGRSRDSE
jgi:hypothetical protein